MCKSDSIVIIPTYNEKENIEKIIRAVFGLEKCFHILVIDDGSPDGTAQIVKGLMASEFAERLFIVERSGKQGLGTAYIAGFRWALERDYGYIFEMDADFSHDPNDLPRLYAACHDEGNDVAVGSRYVSGVNVVNWPMGRVLMSYYASKYVRIITGIKVRDTTAGFVCYKRRVLETIELDKIRFKGYAFQIEMKYTAYKIGFKVKEVPVIFVNRREGTSKMSGGIFSEAFFGVMRLRWDGWRRKYPKMPAAALLAMLLSVAGGAMAQPNVTTSPRYARGATMAFGRMGATANGATISQRGFCYATHQAPTIDDNTTTKTMSAGSGTVYVLENLEPATLYYMRAYAKTTNGQTGYGDVIKFYTLPKGEVTYWYNNGGSDAENTRINNAAKQACQIFNDLTSIKKKFDIGYSAGTPTADCGYKDQPWINMGANSSYQRTGTLMHEMQHGLGMVPYTSQWSKNILRERLDGEGRGSGHWLGERVTAFLDFWDNTNGQQLNGDYQHMWPYGINGAQEDKGTLTLYYANAMLGQALGEDGLEHRSNTFAEPCWVFNHDENTKYYLKNEADDRGRYSAFLVPNAGGALKWREMSAAEAAQNDSAAWYITFTPQNQYYQLRNAATGQYMTYQSTFKTLARTTLTANDNFHLMKGRVNVGSTAMRGYWLIHPTGNLSPNCLTANANGYTGSQAFDIKNTATHQRWLILTAEEAKAFEAESMTFIKQQNTLALEPIKALADVPHTTTDANADQTFRTALANIEQRNTEATTYAESNTLVDEALAAATAFLSVATPTDTNHPFDLTFMVKSAGMDETTGWTGSPAPTLNHSCAEFYQQNFNFRQTIANLPLGTYRVLLQGFQRSGTYTAAYNDWAAGTNRVNATLYASDKTQLLNHIAEGAQTKKLGGSEKLVGGSYYVPDNMEAASIYFAKGLYENMVTKQITTTSLTFGVRSTSMPSSYWCIFDNFRLQYFGSLNEDLTTTAIEQTPLDVDASENGSAYDLSGRRLNGSQQLSKGVYIVNGRKTIIR